jgi:hypothetical protein
VSATEHWPQKPAVVAAFACLVANPISIYGAKNRAKP